MATRKAAKESKAPKRKAAKAAAAEAKPEAKSFDWRGLKLEVPDEMRGELMFAFYDLEEQQRNEEGRVGPMLSLVKSLVGPQQFQEIREKVRTEKLTMEQTDEEIGVLLDGLLGQYGMGLGESSASQDS